MRLNVATSATGRVEKQYDQAGNKMPDWTSMLKYNPVNALLSSQSGAVACLAARDLLGKTDTKPGYLRDLPEAQRLVKKQQSNGSWKYPGGNPKVRREENYDQIETYRVLGYLVEMYGFNKSCEPVTKAADFLFSFQTADGDIRGIYGIQYTPNYTAAMLELLLKAGYTNDSRIEKAFKWLLSVRQGDGGWAVPFRTIDKNLNVITTAPQIYKPDRTKPFSHMVTGVVLRAFAAHKKYRNSAAAHTAGKLLLSHLFKKDNYTDRGSRDFWTRFTYPFWFTDLISAMDTLSLLGFDKDEPQMQEAIQWFIAHQQKSGLWNLKTLKNKSIYHTELWLSLAICRVMKRLYDTD